MAVKLPVAATLDDSFFSAFVMQEEDMSKINEIIRDYLGTNASMSFYFTCADKITREYDAVADARKFDNSRGREIESLWIYATSEDRGRNVSIRISNRRLGTVSLSLKGPGLTVASCKQKIEEWLDGMRPWYAKLATPTVYFLFPILLQFLISGGFIAWMALTGKLDGIWKPVEVTTGVLLIWILAALYGVLHSIALSSLHSWMFPPGIFSVGHGVERAKRLAALRSIFLIGIVLSLFVGTGASLVASFVWQVFS